MSGDCVLVAGGMVLTELTDEQLCALAQAGDAGAANRLAARYISLISARASAYKPISGSFDSEDLGQEGFIGLIGAVNRYNSECGASFRTFAVLNIDRRITDAVRASLRKRQVPDSAKADCDIAGHDSPEATAIMRDTLARINEELRTGTSEIERKSLALHLSGYSYAEVAERLGCSQKSVENALGRVRRKLNRFK